MELIDEHFIKGKNKIVSNAEDKNADMWIEEYGFGYPIDEEEYTKFRKEINKEKKEEIRESKNSLDSIINNALTEVIVENCLGEYSTAIANQDTIII